MSCQFGAPVPINFLRDDGDGALPLDAAQENEARDADLNFNSFTFERLTEDSIGLLPYAVRYVLDSNSADGVGGNGVVQRYKVDPAQMPTIAADSRIRVPTHLAVKLSRSAGALHDEVLATRDLERVGLLHGLRAKPLYARNNIRAVSNNAFASYTLAAHVFDEWKTRPEKPLLVYGNLGLKTKVLQMVRQARPTLGVPQHVTPEDLFSMSTLRSGGTLVVVQTDESLLQDIADIQRIRYAPYTFIVWIPAPAQGIREFSRDVRSRYAVITWDGTRPDLCARVRNEGSSRTAFPYYVGTVMESCGGSIERMEVLRRPLSLGWIETLLSAIIRDSLEIHRITGRIQADLKLANILYTRRSGVGYFLIGDLGGFVQEGVTLATPERVIPTYRRRDIPTNCAAHLAFQLGLMVLFLILQGRGAFVRWLRQNHAALTAAGALGGLDIQDMWFFVPGENDFASSVFGLRYPAGVKEARSGWDRESRGGYMGLRNHVMMVTGEMDPKKLDLAERLLLCDRLLRMDELEALIRPPPSADGEGENELEEGEIKE